MDVNQPIPPVQDPNLKSENKLKSLALLEVGLFELLFIVGGLIIIFGLLNYYNVLPISQSIPFLSFLPQQQKLAENKTQAKSTISQAELYKKIKNELPFSGCPVEPGICKNAEVISDYKSTQSAQWILSYSNLPEGSEILAVLDGTVEIDQSTIILTNKGRLLKAYYEFENDFFSAASTSATVQQGDVLGQITNTSNFNFYLKNTTTNNHVQTKSSPDGKSLLYAGL